MHHLEIKCKKVIGNALILFVALLLPVVCFAVEEPDKQAAAELWQPADNFFIYLMVAVLVAGSLIAILVIKKSLSKTKWSLSDALSEEVSITLTEEDANGKVVPVKDNAGNLIEVKELRASSSRMIALMGMLVILIMFVTFGAIILFSFAKTGVVPASSEKVGNYMITGLTLFAPYLVNKFSNVFK